MKREHTYNRDIHRKMITWKGKKKMKKKDIYRQSGNYIKKAIFITDIQSEKVGKTKYKRCNTKNNAQYNK